MNVKRKGIVTDNFVRMTGGGKGETKHQLVIRFQRSLWKVQYEKTALMET
jgi:hypothetical protein